MNFIDKAIMCFSRHQIQEQFPAEKLNIQQESQGNLEQIRKEVGIFFDKLEKELGEEFSMNAEKLQTHMTQESVLRNITDLPKELTLNTDWKNATVSVRATMFERFEKQINEWEGETGYFKKTGHTVLKKLKAELHKFDSRIHKEERRLLQNMSELYNKKVHEKREKLSSPDDISILKDISFQNIDMDNDNYNDDEREDTIIPPSIRDRFSGLNLGLKVFLGISLSPILLLGMTVMVPLYWKRQIQRMIEKELLEKQFNRAATNEMKRSIITKYAENIKKKLVEPVFFKTVISQGLQQVLSHIQNEHSKVKKMIDSNLELIRILKKTDIVRQSLYHLLCIQCEFLRRYLLHYQITYLRRPTVEIAKADVEISDKIICEGVLLKILHGKRVSEGRYAQSNFSFRIDSIPVDPGNVMKYLEEENAYR